MFLADNITQSCLIWVSQWQQVYMLLGDVYSTVEILFIEALIWKFCSWIIFLFNNEHDYTWNYLSATFFLSTIDYIDHQSERHTAATYQLL